MIGASTPVLITRPAEQGGRTVARFAAAGYVPTHVPCIELAPPPDPATLRLAAERVGTYDWVVFTSQNAVERLRAEAVLALPKVAAIGPETARAFERAFGRKAELVPTSHRAEGLTTELLGALGSQPRRIALFRAERGRDVLPLALAAAGHELDVVITYSVRPARGEAARLATWLRAHAATPPTAWIVLASSLTVESFFELAGHEGLTASALGRAFRFACISPVTERTLADHGIAGALVAAEHTLDGLLRALSTAPR